MRRNRLPEILLALGILIAVALLLWPHRSPEFLQPRRDPVTTAKSSPSTQPTASQPTLLPATVVAQMFSVPGKTPAPATKSTQSDTAVPEPAPNLRFVAFEVDKSGETIYVLKNSSSGAMLLLSVGKSQGGWSLISATNDSLVVVKSGRRYTVARH